MKFSFIVPCYNVEAYIDRCLDSIEALKLSDYEIMAVNDGSTDQTMARLNARGEINSHIVVISQVNQGASAARNNGLNHANGDFAIFVDSDDRVLEGLADVLKSIKSDDQLVLFNVLQQFPLESAQYRIHQQDLDEIDKSQLIRDDLYINAPWGKVIYKSSRIS